LKGEGADGSRILLVGEAPGADEEKHGRPFVGAAGQVLSDVLNQAGLTRADVYISNVVKCRPPQNRTPSRTEADTCLPYLLEEIERVKPKLIVCLGNAAMEALTGAKKMAASRGKVLPPRKGLHIDVPIVATYHPAAVLYERAKNMEPLVENMKHYAKMANGTPALASGDTAVLFDPYGVDVDNIVNLLWELGSAKVLAVDLEWTAGTDGPTWPWTPGAEVYSISVSGRIEGNVRSVALAFPPPPAIADALAALLITCPVVMHNAMSDRMWLHHYRIKVRRAGDTMILGHLLDETQPKNLEALAVKYGGVEPGWKGHLRTTRPSTASEWQDLLSYNAADTRATLLLFEGLIRAINLEDPVFRDAIKRLHAQLLLPVLPVLLRAAYVGVPIDGDLLAVETASAHTRHNAAAEELADLIGVTPLQAAKLANSPLRTREYLKNALGIDLQSSNKDALTSIIRYPQVKAILRCRKESKLLGTYLTPWTTLLTRQRDGRLHTIYRMTGTRTGRLSAEVEMGGSLQVTPRNTSDVAFREMVRAPAGRLIVSGDFSQIELRMIAWIAHERTMLQAFIEGQDLHKLTAAFMIAQRGGAIDLDAFMLRRAEFEAMVTKEDRQGAKGFNFGLSFGMQPPGFREYARRTYGLLLTEQEAIEGHRAFFRLYTALPPWHERARRDAEIRGFTVTPFGRRRQFANSSDVNAAINTPIQSTASDLTLLAMVQTNARLREESLDAVIIGQVHDSILIDVSERDADRAQYLLKWTMEHVDTAAFGITVPVPIVADLKVGATWA